MEGLTQQEAEEKLEQHGPNELEEKDPVTRWKVFKRQFSSVLIWILVAAAIISFAAGEMLEFYFILVIIGIIALMGYIQEWKAEKAMEELQSMTEPVIEVIRDGEVVEIESSEIVPGDVLKLDMGDKIPADAELIESVDIKIDESILTGESEAVKKDDGDEIYSGTTIVHGRAKAKVTATGMDTELGKIADNIQQDDEETPLQRKIDRLGKKLGVVAIFAASVILMLGFFDTEASLATVLIVALALTVASIPEALPLTLTLTLSIGMKDLAKKNAIVKKMLAVEGLGSTTVICTDKTGTLTKNEMTIERLYADGKEYNVEGAGYVPQGNIKYNANVVDPEEDENLRILVETGVLCNNADLVLEEGNYSVTGEPTEASFITLGGKADIEKEQLNEEWERLEEILFTSERKRMTTVNKNRETGKTNAYTKGAPEVVLERCSHILVDGQKKQLDEEKRRQILEKNHEYANEALRVLGLAYKENVEQPFEADSIEKDLTFIGLAGMIDPPREEVKDAIKQCYKAGIDVKMVTGDNPETAKAIARDIELTDNPKVVTGDQLSEMDEDELKSTVPEIDIYARTKPEHKLHIVEALKNNGEIVAMTGDGVNDAPAVKKADVGIGMGQKGTDVTKESSDMLLQDDNFSTIVTAIEDGRRIYDNIEKFTTYLVSRNFTEVTIITLGIIVLGFEFLPLLALQILFLNVIGQEFPAIGLGLDPATKGIMERPPRNPDQGILHKRNLFFVVSMALFMSIAGFIVFMLTDPIENLDLARTTLFTAIVLMILVHAFNFRSLTESIFDVGFFGNKWILLAVALTTPLLLATIYIPTVAEWFEHVPMGTEPWIVAIVGAFATFVFIEVLKYAAKNYFDDSYMWKQ